MNAASEDGEILAPIIVPLGTDPILHTIASESCTCTSDDSSSSDSGDSADDLLMHQLANPAMDSDDESVDGAATQLLHTRNEILKPAVLPIDVVISSEMRLGMAGHVHMLVEDHVIVKAGFSGQERVLEDGTVLVFEDRSIFGRIFETFGPVSHPMFSVLFNRPEDIDRDLVVVGKPVFYVPDLSVWTITDQLRRMRGCDASNQDDEEIDEKEMEFSDDEQEREFRQRSKLNSKTSHSQSEKPKFVRAAAQNVSLTNVFDYKGGSGRGGRTVSRMQNNQGLNPPKVHGGLSINDLFTRYATPPQTPDSEPRKSRRSPVTNPSSVPPTQPPISRPIHQYPCLQAPQQRALQPAPRPRASRPSFQPLQQNAFQAPEQQAYPSTRQQLGIQTSQQQAFQAPQQQAYKPLTSNAMEVGPPVNALSLFHDQPKRNRPPMYPVPPAEGFSVLRTYTEPEDAAPAAAPTPPAPDLAQLLLTLQAMQAPPVPGQQNVQPPALPADTLTQILSVLSSVAGANPSPT